MSLPHLPHLAIAFSEGGPSKKILIGLLTSLLTLGIGLTLVNNYETLQYITPTNVTPFTTTLTWTSPNKAKGCIIIANASLPKGKSAPQYLSNLATVDFLCEKNSSFNHSLTLGNLRAEKTYRLLLLSGSNYGFYTIQHPFIPDSLPPLPNVAYGKLVTKDTNTPIKGATIIAQTPKGPVSTQTTPQGTWSLDLRGVYPLNTPIPVTINWQFYHLEDNLILMGQHQPAPDFAILDQKTLDQANSQFNSPLGLSILRI